MSQYFSPKQSGFTVIELIVAIVVALFAAGLFIVQKSDVDARGRDELRKQDINAVYYYLNDLYFARHKGYPAELSADKLPGLNPSSLEDPDERKVNSENSDYTYKAMNCNNIGLCKHYELTAKLQKEGDFSKKNPSR